jgi:2',3'-cyclic-nucleotide 2'-phosphodiesterase (5'-nucleotidase family)
MRGHDPRMLFMPTLTILHTNDLHARLDQMIRLATLIQRERAQASAEGRSVLLLDAGDSSSSEMWESDMTGGRANYAMLEAMAYDSAVIGNSDSQWGREPLARLLTAVHFQTLAANLRDAATDSRPTALGDYALFKFTQPGSPDAIPANIGSEDPTRADEIALAVGVIGLTTGEETHPDFRALDPAKTLRALIPQVQNEGAHIVIVLSHLGVDNDRKLAAEAPGIHVIIGGHTHTILQEPESVGGTIIAQTGEYGNFLGRLDLEWIPKSLTSANVGDVGLRAYRLIPCPETTPPDPTLAGMLELIRFEADVLRKKSGSQVV